MIQSNDHKFIFIHNAKTGGTSIHIALCEALKGTDFIKFSSPRIQRKRTKPYRRFSLETRDVVGEEIWNKYFTFAFVRNPYDRLISMFFHLQSKGTDKGPLIKRFNDIDSKCLNCTDKQEGFKRFVDITIVNKLLSNYHWQPQHYMLCDKSNKIIVDFVGRYEKLVGDTNFILNRLDVGRVNLPHKYKSSHGPFMDYYDNETLDIVRDYYEKDINMFNYE